MVVPRCGVSQCRLNLSQQGSVTYFVSRGCVLIDLCSAAVPSRLFVADTMIFIVSKAVSGFGFGGEMGTVP